MKLQSLTYYTIIEGDKGYLLIKTTTSYGTLGPLKEEKEIACSNVDDLCDEIKLLLNHKEEL